MVRTTLSISFVSLTWVFLSLLLSSCNFHTDNKVLTLSDPNNSKISSISSYDAMKLNILDTKCLRCHGANGAGGVDLSSYTSIMSNPGLVTVGNLQKSRLYTEVFTGSMPDGEPALSPAEILSIAKWIQSGATNGNFPTDTPSPSQPNAPTEPGPAPAPQPPADTVYSQIQTKLFDQSCVRCHSGPKPSSKIDLSSYQKMMTGKKIVIVPGDPEKSTAYTEIVDGSMPPRGETIDPNLVELLKNWIAQGAKETE